MFCKWCGATLPNAAGKCPRCGKEAPPLSDCGGFYDLMPAVKQPPATLPGYTSQPPKTDHPKAATPQTNLPPKAAAPQTHNQPARKKNILPLLIACVCFLLIFAFLLSMNSKLERILRSDAQQDKKINAIGKELSEVKDAIAETVPDQTTPQQTTPQQTTPEQTTPPLDTTTEPDELRLEDQDVKFEIAASHDVYNPWKAVELDFGRFEDVNAELWPHYFHDDDGAPLANSHLHIMLNNAQCCLGIKIDIEPEAPSKGVGRVFVGFDPDPLVFAQEKDSPVYEWVYRTEGADEWLALDENVFIVSKDGSFVTYAEKDLAALLNGKDTAEFQLTYRRDNSEGGSLTVVISGITITCQPLDTQATPAN